MLSLQNVRFWIRDSRHAGGAQSVTKNRRRGRRDALWEDLHTVLCTMELPTARWADSVLQQYLGAPPHNVNASAQWDRSIFYLEKLWIGPTDTVHTIVLNDPHVHTRESYETMQLVICSHRSGTRFSWSSRRTCNRNSTYHLLTCLNFKLSFPRLPVRKSCLFNCSVLFSLLCS